MANIEIVRISREGAYTTFSKEGARALLPIIKKITSQYASRVDRILQQLESIDLKQTTVIEKLEAQANELIFQWHSKVERLGAKPKGLWYVDFDFGDGCLCWKYPEQDLFYWHSHEDGFTGRKLLDQSKPAPLNPLDHENKEENMAQDCSSSD